MKTIETSETLINHMRNGVYVPVYYYTWDENGFSYMLNCETRAITVREIPAEVKAA